MKTKIPIRLLNIEGDGYHLLVHITINGKKANVILDTGASKTVFDKQQVVRFLGKEKITDNERLSTGLGTNSMQSHMVTLKKISLGKIELANYKSIVLDLSHVNKTYQSLGLRSIDGVIGSDIFEKFAAVIDFGKKKMTLLAPKSKKKKSIPRKKPAKKKNQWK